MSATDFGADITNPHAMKHRQRRAVALLRAFRARGLTPYDALGHSTDWWGRLAVEAGLDRPPSQITIAMAQGLIEAPELAGLKFPTKGGTE